MIRKTALLLGWLTVMVIVYSTLSPIQLRPRTGHPNGLGSTMARRDG